MLLRHGLSKSKTPSPSLAPAIYLQRLTNCLTRLPRPLNQGHARRFREPELIMLNLHRGDPSNGGAGPGWIQAKTTELGLGAVLGMTNEISRFGKQALFVDFRNFPGGVSNLRLRSDLLAVTPGQILHLRFWNRLDAKNPVKTSGDAIIKFSVTFFKTEFGDEPINSEYPYAPLTRGKGNEELNAATWSVVERSLTVPAEAASVQIEILWQSTSPMDGMIYFDDFQVFQTSP